MSLTDEKVPKSDAKVEEEDEDEDDMPEAEAGAAGHGRAISRNEKKVRKALQKMGMKTISGISRVTMKNNKNYIFAIDAPEVLKSPASETYVVFGEAKPQDQSTNLQNLAAQQFKMPTGATATTGASSAADEQDEAPEDQGDVADADIETVVMQTQASKNKAIRALKEHGNVVDAIMALTNV